jgi:molybdopterin synthase catalytic subunit
MSITIAIIDGPLPAAVPHRSHGAGAVVIFEGVVRPEEAGAAIAALDYQTYEPMAQRELQRLAAETLEKHGLLAIHVEHSRGQVPAGEISFRLTIASAHRKAALAAMDEFIDRMKQDVPIWKAAKQR